MNGQLRKVRTIALQRVAGATCGEVVEKALDGGVERNHANEKT